VEEKIDLKMREEKNLNGKGEGRTNEIRENLQRKTAKLIMETKKIKKETIFFIRKER